MTTIYGIKNELLSSFVERSDWNVLLNKRSTTFRNLPAEIKDNLTDDVMFKAVLEQPTLLKRPILIRNDVTCVGFKDDLYQENLL